MKKYSSIENFTVAVFKEVIIWCKLEEMDLDAVFSKKESRYHQIRRIVTMEKLALHKEMSDEVDKQAKTIPYYKDLSKIVFSVADKHPEFKRYLEAEVSRETTKLISVKKKG